MTITGKIISVPALQQGVAQSTGKPWKKQEFVLETLETYPKKAAFTLFGDKVDKFPINVGEIVNVTFDVNAREYNGRWYNSLEPWKIEPAGGVAAPAAGNPANPAVPQTPYPGTPAQPAAQPMAAAPQQVPPAQPLPPAGAPTGGDDDLPF